MPTTNNSSNSYPPVSFYFNVVFKGAGLSEEVGFKEISGLEAGLGEEVIGEGGKLHFKHRLPLPSTYKNLAPETRGLGELQTAYMDRGRDLQFQVCASDRKYLRCWEPEGKAQPQMIWSVSNVRPVKWDVSSFDSEANKIAVETLELAFDRIETKPGKA